VINDDEGACRLRIANQDTATGLEIDFRKSRSFVREFSCFFVKIDDSLIAVRGLVRNRVIGIAVRGIGVSYGPWINFELGGENGLCEYQSEYGFSHVTSAKRNTLALIGLRSQRFKVRLAQRVKLIKSPLLVSRF
jgi:hypothetical protein